MNNQTKCLLDILRCGMYGEPLPSCEDWKGAYQFAKMHSVANIFYQAIKDAEIVPFEIKEAAKTHYHANIHQQILQDYYAEQIFSALEKAQIRYMPLKGYYLRQLYPMPELRTSCDVDFFYDVTRTDELNEILKSEGFIEDTGGPNHSVWQKDTTTLEPHFYLLSDNDRFHAYYQNVWERLKSNGGALHSFSDEDFYIFFIVHAAKHFTHGGFGIRTVLDVHVYNTVKKLDRNYLMVEFQKLGLAKFVTSIEALAECWFGHKEMDENTNRLGDYVIESGTYGVNLHSIMLNNVKEKKVGGSRFSYFWKTLFLPYKQMKTRYPTLQKAPILLPFYWVKRWFGVLFKRRENIGKTVKSMKSMDAESVSKYSKILEITEIPLD